MNPKNIKDLTTNSDSTGERILINSEILELQETEETVIDNRKDSLNEISAQKKFDQYLIEAIDEALTSLGAPVKNTVYFQLENNFNIPKTEIPKQIDKFSDILHKIFGFGASRLEIMIIQNLRVKTNVKVELNEYEWPLSKWIVSDISFVEYVYNARKNYSKNERCA